MRASLVRRLTQGKLVQCGLAYLAGVWLLLLLPGLLTAQMRTIPAAKHAPAGEPAREEYLQVPGGRIWYRVVGNGSGTPVIVLHGGPGYPSYVLRPFEALGDERVVVRYDQLGAGRSERVNDTTLFTIPHFVAELDSLRAHLGYERVDLLGQSWGTTLAVEYYRVHPEHVRAMVLGGALLSTPAWEATARRLLQTLPESERKAVATAEASGNFNTPAYQAAVTDYYARYLRRHPVQASQADYDSTSLTANEGIYNYMWGPSEFTATGTLKHYDSTAFLRQVKVPVLYVVGEFDEAGPDNVKRFAALTPGSRVVVLEGAAHSPWDAGDEDIRIVRKFLKQVDADGRR